MPVEIKREGEKRKREKWELEKENEVYAKKRGETSTANAY